jgi:hypothetical protein
MQEWQEMDSRGARGKQEDQGTLRGVRCVEQGRICSQRPRTGDMSRAHNVGITFKLHRRLEDPFRLWKLLLSACRETAIVIVLVVNAY